MVAISGELTPRGHYVIVTDMARKGGPGAERLIPGFATLSEARAYAEARLRDSLEELRGKASAETLRQLWHI